MKQIVEIGIPDSRIDITLYKLEDGRYTTLEGGDPYHFLKAVREHIQLEIKTFECILAQRSPVLGLFREMNQKLASLGVEDHLSNYVAYDYYSMLETYNQEAKLLAGYRTMLTSILEVMTTCGPVRAVPALPIYYGLIP